MNFKYIISFFFLFVNLLVKAQVTGGQHVIKLFELSQSSRITGLGGSQIAVADEDVVLASQNPAVLNPLMNGRLSINHNFFISDLQHSYLAYGEHLPKIGITVHGAFQHLNYGELIRADEFGNQQGTFEVSENAFVLGAARPLSSRLSMGLNLRFGFSRLDTYRSSALAADAGIFYADTARLFTAAMVVRNAGAQMKTYSGTREELPLDIQIAVTKRLRHLPFRLTILMHHLHQWDIRYNDPALENDDDILVIGGDGDSGNSKNPGIDNFFRHFIFSGEFLFGKTEVMRLRFGYNHLRRKELTVQNFTSFAGFSAGIGFKLNRLRLDAGFGSYHLASGVFHVGLSTDLKSYFQ